MTPRFRLAYDAGVADSKDVVTSLPVSISEAARDALRLVLTCSSLRPAGARCWHARAAPGSLPEVRATASRRSITLLPNFGEKGRGRDFAVIAGISPPNQTRNNGEAH